MRAFRRTLYVYYYEVSPGRVQPDARERRGNGAEPKGMAMDEDERAIRAVVAEWQRATAAGELDTVLGLMTDDMLFLTPGQEPFGRARFAAASRGQNFAVDGRSDIQELEIAGNWAWARTHISVTITHPDGSTNARAGYTMSIFRRQPDGRWLLARDANLLAGPS